MEGILIFVIIVCVICIFYSGKEKENLKAENNILWYYSDRGYKIEKDITWWGDVSSALKLIGNDYFFVHINGPKKSGCFILNRNDTWDLMVGVSNDKKTYLSKKENDYIMFGISYKTSHISVMNENSEEVERIKKECRKTGEQIKKITFFTEDHELKECLGYQPRRYYVE